MGRTPAEAAQGPFRKMAPLMCRSTNRRFNVAEPEVWFRIVHITPDTHTGAPVAAYREQTVEITLGPKPAFEKGNVGRLTRLVHADRVVSAVSPRGKTKPPKDPKTPRVLELLRKAIEWREPLESGEAASQAAIARREGITRARITQVMGMLRLASEIQQHILSMPDMVRRPALTERVLRPIVKIEERNQQLAVFSELLNTATAESVSTNHRRPLAPDASGAGLHVAHLVHARGIGIHRASAIR